LKAAPDLNKFDKLIDEIEPEKLIGYLEVEMLKKKP
jgi:hypothetical protein